MAALILLACLVAQQAPVPDQEKQKEAEALIREIFKAEYSRKGEFGALARKLLAQAEETRDDPVTRFVLLREARDLAVQSVDLPTCMKAVELTAAAYAVDGLAMKHAALLSLGKAVKTTDEVKSLLARSMKLVDEAFEVDQYEVAKQSAEAAVALARRLKDLPSVTRAELKVREATDRRDRSAKVRVAQETLAHAPEDPSANLVVGQFECCIKRQWENGLPKLAKGADGAIKLQAAADLAAPADLLGRIKVGDGWWDLAEKGEPAIKAAFQERARHWYLLALPEAKGLTKARLENRMAGTWIPIFDGRTLDFMRPAARPAWEVVDGLLCKKPEINEYFQTVQLFQDGEFRVRFEIQGLTLMTFSARQGVQGKDSLMFTSPKIAELEGKVREILFQCRGADVKAFLDGVPMALYTRGPVVEGHLQFGGHGPTLKIHSFEYRQIK